jgi:hypothetical protein
MIKIGFMFIVQSHVFLSESTMQAGSDNSASVFMQEVTDENLIKEPGDSD